MNVELLDSAQVNDFIFSLEEESGLNLLQELFKEIFTEVGERRNQFVARENMFAFKHGVRWSGYTENDESTFDHWNSGFRKHSSTATLSHDSIFNADFSAIDSFKQQMTEAIIADFETSIFRTIEEATEGRPPIELKLNGDIKPAIKEMWETIKLGLNEDLTLSAPSMAMNSENFEKFSAKIKELIDTDPAFIQKLERIKLKKWIEALMDHFNNLLKFQLHDEKRGYFEHQLRQLRQIGLFELHEGGCNSDQGKSS